MAVSREKLAESARIAWRNNSRCIGRLFWSSLELHDARDAATAEDVYEACINHLRVSTNSGRIRPLITVFPPANPERGGIRIRNRQLVRYAGYLLPDGRVLGDPEQLVFTSRVLSLGWNAPVIPSAFDLLPLLIEIPGESPRLFDLPPEAVMEVEISHPFLPWFADLGLKWHALPAVCDMALEADGLRYTAAPFSGFYMLTEIGSRNLGDTCRYDQTRVVAERMGLDTGTNSSFWKDRALVELNAAVLHSFRKEGVTIVDHHTASEQFMRHLENEKAIGRKVPGDWPWLVPPLSGSACPVFHRYYDGEVEGPRFVRMKD
jgi:nitric-oxide synthase